MKTYLAKREERGQRWQQDWVLVDATDQPLGRLATRIALLLQGKHKPHYTPHVDVGDVVVVINANKIRYTGKKREEKLYRHYTGYPGGLKEQTLAQVLQRHPTKPLKEAVRRMMPKNKLARRMMTKLKVYTGPDHPHAAQNPRPLDLETFFGG